MPLLLCHHVFFNMDLNIVRVVGGRIRGANVANKQTARALELTSHFVGKELIAQLNACIRTNGKPGGIHANKAMGGKGIYQVVHMRARCGACIHDQVAEVAVHGEKLHFGQQKFALAPVDDCLRFVTAPMVRQRGAVGK